MAQDHIYPNPVNLGTLCGAGKVMLDVACRHCSRRGRYRVTRLIDRHTAAMGLPQLKDIIAADCPKRKTPSIYDRCGVYFPGPLPSPDDTHR